VITITVIPPLGYLPFKVEKRVSEPSGRNRLARHWLKDCPRCRGDRCLEEGFDEPEIVCIQCGYRTYLPPGLVSLPFAVEAAAVHRAGGVAA
jgi:hypothetical protein